MVMVIIIIIITKLIIMTTVNSKVIRTHRNMVEINVLQ